MANGLTYFKYQIIIIPKAEIRNLWELKNQIEKKDLVGYHLAIVDPKQGDTVLIGYYLDMPSAHIAQYVKWLKSLDGVSDVLKKNVNIVPRPHTR